MFRPTCITAVSRMGSHVVQRTADTCGHSMKDMGVKHRCILVPILNEPEIHTRITDDGILSDDLETPSSLT
jgi:hypothetical protein